MARLKDLRSTWEEYKGWFFLLLTVYVLFSLRKVFSALGDTAGAAAEAATAGITKSATTSADKAKAQAATGNKNTKFTDAQVATFRQDAQNLCEYLGRGVGFGMQNLFKDQKSAFSLIKQRYSRLNLYYNKPWHYVTIAGKKTIQTQLNETQDSVKNTINWRVLAPFYLELSGGHSLEADLRYYITDSDLKPYLKWLL